MQIHIWSILRQTLRRPESKSMSGSLITPARRSLISCPVTPSTVRLAQFWLMLSILKVIAESLLCSPTCSCAESMLEFCSLKYGYLKQDTKLNVVNICGYISTSSIHYLRILNFLYCCNLSLTFWSVWFTEFIFQSSENHINYSFKALGRMCFTAKQQRIGLFTLLVMERFRFQ